MGLFVISNSPFVTKEQLMKFFSTEGGIYKFMTRLWDMIKLNFLWLICSLPIVTIGASTIAAFTITLKMVEEKEGYVARAFFKAFKANFKQGIVIGPITVVFAAALYLDFTLGKQYIGFVILGILSAFLFGIAIIYTYPLLARYENKLLKTIRNSMRIAMRYFGRTIFLVVVLVIEYIIFFRFTNITLLIGILVGPATMILTVSGFAMYFFREIEKAGGVTTKKTEEDLYNEEIERETQNALKAENKNISEDENQ